MAVWKCGEFADIPYDWVCPVCAAGKHRFTEQ
jgi:rubredoxin